MASRIKRPAKAKAASQAASSSRIPAYIRSVDGILKETDKAYLRRKLDRKLSKFAGSVERTSVRVEDVNGPRGGTDKRCAIKVVLRGLPTVFIEERHASLQAAMDGALARIERAVRQSLQRRRTKPLRVRKSEGRRAALA
ncbi:MAG: HPF/RaiA family ribosome-associated protein [Xanthomonadaceae bacterium]|nr:HPF/RaiA family ribosome-associated protein [Xanthomonadaceae bacterium]